MGTLERVLSKYNGDLIFLFYILFYIFILYFLILYYIFLDYPGILGKVSEVL